MIEIQSNAQAKNVDRYITRLYVALEIVAIVRDENTDVRMSCDEVEKKIRASAREHRDAIDKWEAQAASGNAA